MNVTAMIITVMYRILIGYGLKYDKTVDQSKVLLGHLAIVIKLVYEVFMFIFVGYLTFTKTVMYVRYIRR